MKTTQYQCLKCLSTMKFKIVNTGVLPTTIGCKTVNCSGRSIEMKMIEEKEDDFDGAFFRPETNVEWDAVRNQLNFEVKKQYPHKKPNKQNRIVNKVMDNFRKHTREGGLVFLPIAYFSKVEKND